VLEHQRDRTRALERTRGQIILWVFHRAGAPIKTFRRSWRTACRLAGLPGKMPHDFRRTAVRNLERAGVPRSAAMKMVGHKTESVYRRYAIADQAMLREAGDKVGRFQARRTTTTAPRRFPDRERSGFPLSVPQKISGPWKRVRIAGLVCVR
jgi:integrase